MPKNSWNCVRSLNFFLYFLMVIVHLSNLPILSKNHFLHWFEQKHCKKIYWAIQRHCKKKIYWIVKDYELLSVMYHSLSCCHMKLSKWPRRMLFPGIIFVWMYEIWKSMGYSSHIPIISLYFEYIFLEFNTFSSLFIWL